MKKYSILLFIFVFLFMISSVSAADYNSTDNDYLTLPENDYQNSIPNYISYTENNLANYDNDVVVNNKCNSIDNEKQSLKSSDNDVYSSNGDSLVVTFDEEEPMWVDGTGSGVVSVVDGDYDGKCLKLEKSKIIYFNMDWDNIEKVSFQYKPENIGASLDVYISSSEGSHTNEILHIDTASSTDWTLCEYDASDLTGNMNLYFDLVGKRSVLYIDSLTFNYKTNSENSLVVTFDEEEPMWVDGTGSGVVSVVDGDYDGKCLKLEKSKIIYFNMDWDNIEKVSFQYKPENIGAGLDVYISSSEGSHTNEILHIDTASSTDWTLCEYDASDLTGNMNLYFDLLGEKSVLYIDSLIFDYKTNSENINELLETNIIINSIESNKVIISLKDVNENPIPNVNISYIINDGIVNSKTTDANGQIITDVVGDVNIYASFLGNDEYLPSNVTTKLLTTNFNFNASELGGIIITLKNSEGKVIPNVNVNYVINEGIINSAITNDIGQIFVRNVMGDANISANFSGNKIYFASQNNATIHNISYSANPIINPYFDEGELGQTGNVYGWNVSAGAAHGGSHSSGVITNFKGSRVLFLEQNYYGYKISQYINFDCIDKISFKYYCLDAINVIVTNFNIVSSIGGNVVENNQTPNTSGWQEVIIDTKVYSGINLFELYFPKLSGNTGDKIYFDDFTVVFNDNIVSEFTYYSILNGENINVIVKNQNYHKNFSTHFS